MSENLQNEFLHTDFYEEGASDEVMSEALKDMVQMMDNPTPEYCEALCMTELGGLRQKEYANKMNISYSGAKFCRQ